MDTTLKLTSCLVMLLLVLAGCPAQEQEPSTAPPTDQSTPDTPGTTPGDNGVEPQEPITTPTPRDGIGGIGGEQGMQQIADQLRQRIQQDPQLSGNNVSVQVQNGQIVLSGTVQSDQAKQRIEQLAQQLGGNRVQSQLQVSQQDPSLQQNGQEFGQ